jgi:hypothetical protein
MSIFQELFFFFFFFLPSFLSSFLPSSLLSLSLTFWMILGLDSGPVLSRQALYHLSHSTSPGTLEYVCKGLYLRMLITTLSVEML